MRTATILSGLCFLIVAGSAAGAGSQQQRPSLAVTDMRPFEVRGTGFEPGERVQVLLALNGSQRFERAVASSSGTFTVRFAVSFRGCSRYMIKALGSKGSSARVLPRRAQIDCVSPASSGS